ncbi:MAG: DUF1127 domain-containing protein [Pseudomonadota bacterium]|nr:DUF1127 domain-containing protein [Pseudomonadota bacterium]
MYMERQSRIIGTAQAGQVNQIDYRRAYQRAHELRAEAFRRTVGGAWRLTKAGAAAAWRRIQDGRARRKAESELNALSDATLRDIAVARGDIPYLVRQYAPRGGR